MKIVFRVHIVVMQDALVGVCDSVGNVAQEPAGHGTTHTKYSLRSWLSEMRNVARVVEVAMVW